MKTFTIDSNNIEKALLLSRHDVEELLTMPEAIKAVEESFALLAQGKATMPPKLYLDLPFYHGDFRAMPASISSTAGLKWVSVYPDNPEHNLPTVMATIILNDPNTGAMIAVMDGTYITDVRTGAAGGVAIKHLARKNSSTVGVIGAGMQAKTQLLAAAEVLPTITEVKVYDQRSQVSLQYATEMAAKLGIAIRSVETVKEAADADVVITTTPSRKPIIGQQVIKPGTHINAIGADAEGKQELNEMLVKSAKVVVDDFQQACHSGEINVPISKKVMEASDIYGTLGEIIAGIKEGRENSQETTIFDSTGLATQDLICAKLVYEKAVKTVAISHI